MSQVDFGIRVLVSSGNSGQQQRRLRRELRETQRQAERTGAVGSKAMDGVAESTEKAGNNTRLLRNHLIAAAAAFGGLTLIPKLFGALDQFGQLQNRLRVVTEDGEDAQRMFQRLSDVALSTRSSLRGTVEMFTRISLATKDLGLEQERVVKLTRSINQAIIISGATAKEAENGLIQLSQGLASGALRGDELRSVLEQLPAVADVIASRLKVSRGELRKLGEEGVLTTGVIINAFEDAADDLQTKFGTQITTLSQSLENLKTIFTRDVGQSFSDFGGMTILIGAVQTLNVAIPILFRALMILAVLFAGRFAAGVYLSYWRLVTLSKAARATTLSVGLLGETVGRTTVKLTLMQRVMKLGVFGKFALIATGISLAWTAVAAIFGKTADITADLNKKFQELDETIQSTGLAGAERAIAAYEKYGETVSNIITQLEEQLRVEQDLIKTTKRGYQARRASVQLIEDLREQIALEKERLAILSRGNDTGQQLIDKMTGKLEEQVAVLEMRNRIETQYGTQRERDRANAMYDFVRAVEKSVGVQNMESETVGVLIRRYAEAWDYSMRLKDAKEANAAAGELLISMYGQLRGMILGVATANKLTLQEFSDAFSATFDRIRDKTKGFLESLGEMNDRIRATALEFGSGSLQIEAMEEKLMEAKLAMDLGYLSAAQYNAKIREMAMSAIDTVPAFASLRTAVSNVLKGTKEDVDTLGESVKANFMIGIAGSITDAFVDMAKTGEFNIKKLVSSMLEQLLRLLLMLKIIVPLMNAIGGKMGMEGTFNFSGGGLGYDPKRVQNGGSWLVGQPTSRFPGFANGGSMMVGGNGGTDSQLVAFRASPNERVTVTRPEQSIGGNTTVNVSVHNNAPGTEARVEQGENGDYRVIVDQLKGAIAGDISRGGTGLNAALEGRYGLNGASGIQLG